jgi:hypothetical protein
MLTKLFTSYHRLLLILALFLLPLSTSFAQQLEDYLSNYDCSRNTVSQTLQIDADSNGVFETYGVKLCDQEVVQTFPISAKGNIRRWPPTGGPTHCIAFDYVDSTISFLQTYYNRSGNIIAWFQKSADNDTVFFHENVDAYRPRSFGYDSTAMNLQAFPNPAQAFLNIHYVVRQEENVDIRLLTYEGELVAQIINTPSGVGDYMTVFDVSSFDEGYYILRYANGSSTYSITIAIIR